MTLEFARSLEVEPGSNLRGEQADTSWLFLLPSLDLERTVIIGSAVPGTLRALASLSSALVVVGPSRTTQRRLQALEARRSGSGTITIRPDLPAGDRPALVHIDAASAAAAVRDPRAIEWLTASLAQGASVYLAPGRSNDRASLTLAARLGAGSRVELGAAEVSLSGRDRSATGSPGAVVVWTVPSAGTSARSDRLPRPLRVLSSVVRRLAPGAAGRRRAAAAARVSEPDRAFGVAAFGSLSDPAPRCEGAGMLLSAADGRHAGSLPAYLLAAGRATGFPLSEHGWRLAPPRGYRSQKVIFFVRSASGRQVVVKLTQDPAFNVLLDNEAAALARLGELGLTRAPHGPRVPELCLHTAHGGLTIVAQTALQGRPFVERAARQRFSASAGAVAASLTTLGARTKATAGADLGEALLETVDRFTSLYGAAAPERTLLETAARDLGELAGELPLVLMHGDATVYNVLIADDKTVGLVDWENAEARGMPLWDLLHFLQSHRAWQVEGGGGRYTMRSYADQFLRDPEEGAAEARAIAAYCAAVGVPAEARAPLRRLWLARHAVREARQIPPSRLGRSLYRRLLATETAAAAGE